jgi:hypothetical protein
MATVVSKTTSITPFLLSKALPTCIMSYQNIMLHLPEQQASTISYMSSDLVSFASRTIIPLQPPYKGSYKEVKIRTL